MGRGRRAEGTAGAKDLGQHCAWFVGGTVKRSMCLEQRDGGGDGEEGRVGKAQGRSCRTLGTARRIWDFPPGRWESGRATGRGGQDLTEGLTGALWWPMRGGGLVRD